MDRTEFLAQLTWKLGDEKSVWFVNLAIGLLAISMGAAAAITRRGSRFVRLGIALMLLAASREFQFFAVKPVPLAVGLVMEIAGAVLCLRAFSVFN